MKLITKRVIHLYVNFPQNKALENHTRRAHGSKSRCQPCDKTFLDEEDLMSHMKEHHEKSRLENTFFNPYASYQNNFQREKKKEKK